MSRAVSFAVAGALAVTDAFALQVQIAQKPPDDAFDNVFEARGDTVRPRVLVMRGCSGSSAIMQFARHLLRYHGIPVPSAEIPRQDEAGNAAPPKSYGWPAEMLKPNVNWFYERAGEDWGKAMELAQEDVLSQNQTLFFKGMVQEIDDDDMWNQLKPAFVDLQMLPVLGSRTNMLDQVICQVKDCFQLNYGIPVDSETGERSHLCFDRRDVEGTSIQAQNEARNGQLIADHAVQQLEASTSYLYLTADGYKAKLDAERIMESIQNEFDLVDKAKTNMEEAGLVFKEIDEEDLMDFETDMPGAMDRGVKAWMDLLVSFGVDPDEAVVRNYLKQYANTYPQPEPHSELIANIDEIKQALKGTQYEKFIRD